MVLNHNTMIPLFHSHFDLVLPITEHSQSISELLFNLHFSTSKALHLSTSKLIFTRMTLPNGGPCWAVALRWHSAVMACASLVTLVEAGPFVAGLCDGGEAHVGRC